MSACFTPAAGPLVQRIAGVSTYDAVGNFPSQYFDSQWKIIAQFAPRAFLVGE
jgi:hypothetical protein